MLDCFVFSVMNLCSCIPAVCSCIFSCISLLFLLRSMCRDLGDGESIHLFDAALDCNSTSYQIVRVIAFVCMIIYPIGVPVSFGVMLYANRKVLACDYDKDIDRRQFKQLATNFLYVRRESLGAEYTAVNDSNEFAAKMRADTKYDDQALDKTFNEMDTDKSGVISYGELASFSISHVFELETGTTTIDETDISLEALNGGAQAASTSQQPDSGGHAARGRPETEHDGSLGTEQSWWNRNFICDQTDGAKAKEKYQFLVKAYDPGCYWFELVEYARKLLVLGVLLFADQGSISQMYLALVISFTVVLITMRYMPFKNDQTDMYKIAMDVVSVSITTH